MIPCDLHTEWQCVRLKNHRGQNSDLMIMQWNPFSKRIVKIVPLTPEENTEINLLYNHNQNEKLYFHSTRVYEPVAIELKIFTEISRNKLLCRHFCKMQEYFVCNRDCKYVFFNKFVNANPQKNPYCLFMIQEYCEGLSLDLYLNKNKIPLNDAKVFVFQALMALQDMHVKMGAIHGDLQISNIFLRKCIPQKLRYEIDNYIFEMDGPGFEACLGDFGASRIFEHIDFGKDLYGDYYLTEMEKHGVQCIFGIDVCRMVQSAIDIIDSKKNPQIYDFFLKMFLVRQKSIGDLLLTCFSEFFLGEYTILKN